MNMRKIIGTAATSLMALSILVQPALAQAPNLGPDWVVVKERKVKTFVPSPEKPGSGTWQLIDVTNRTYFLEDGQVSRKVSSSRKESGEISLGQTARLYDAEQIQKRTKGEALKGDVPNSRQAYNQGDYLITYKLVRYNLFEDVSGIKPWTIYNRAATRTRDVNYYVLEWTDPVTKERLSEFEPTPEYTDWVVGAPYNKGVASSGNEAFTRREPLGTDDRRVVLSRVYSPTVSLSDLNSRVTSNKVGTFLSNKGQGNSQVALSGSKLRAALGANSAIASQAKVAKTTGGTIGGTGTPEKGDPGLIDKIAGNWQLEGGSESHVSIQRAGKSDNVKVGVKLKGRLLNFEHSFTTAFAQSMSGSKDGQTVSLQFNAEGTELSLAFGQLKAKFYKDAPGKGDGDRDGKGGDHDGKGGGHDGKGGGHDGKGGDHDGKGGRH